MFQMAPGNAKITCKTVTNNWLSEHGTYRSCPHARRGDILIRRLAVERYRPELLQKEMAQGSTKWVHTA